jgi:hypothetical protein
MICVRSKRFTASVEKYSDRTSRLAEYRFGANYVAAVVPNA